MPDTRPSGQPSPAMQDIPVGIDTHGKRREFDSMGEAQVPADGGRGAQTQRSPHHFPIGDRMPEEVHRAYDAVKKACALVNAMEGRGAQGEVNAIVCAADKAIAGKLDGSTLKEAAVQSGDAYAQKFDEAVDPRKMVGHGVAGA